MYSIIDDNNDFIVINKNANVSLHNEQGDGLIQTLRQDLGCDSIFPVHRLDKATSGLLLLAKNHKTNSQLSQLFQKRSVAKYYLAISDKKPAKKQGAIIGDMVRTRNGSWKLSRRRDNPAITQFFSYGLDDGRRLFLLKPVTGKTHQLRVALKSLGAPIVNDGRYGDNIKTAREIMLLHAYCLRFDYNASPYTYICSPNESSFSHSVLTLVNDQLSEPWQLSWPTLPQGLIRER